jgi:hypothetical protein
VKADGAVLKSSLWEWRQKGKTLRASFRADRDARVTVIGC